MTSLTDTQVVTASGGLVELGYGQITSPVTVASTSFTTPTTIIPDVTVVCDGSPIMVEFYAPQTAISAGQSQIVFALWEDGAEKHRYWQLKVNPTGSTGTDYDGVKAEVRLTPSAGTHTYRVVGISSPANNAVLAGSGATTNSPAFLRVSKIVQATQWPAVTTGTIICTSSTRPASPFEGQTIYETDNSRQLVWDGSAWVSPSVTYRPPMCKLTRGSNQTIANNIITVVAYDTAAIDTDSMATTGASAKITANTAGVYAVGYTVLWGSTSTVGYRQAWVTINGSGRYAGSTIYPLNSGTGAWFITGSDIVELSAGQYVDLRVVQASGGNETIGPFAGTPTAFYAYWLGQP